MSKFEKLSYPITGMVGGYMIAGPLGLALGGAIGFWLSDLRERSREPADAESRVEQQSIAAGLPRYDRLISGKLFQNRPGSLRIYFWLGICGLPLTLSIYAFVLEQFGHAGTPWVVDWINASTPLVSTLSEYLPSFTALESRLQETGNQDKVLFLGHVFSISLVAFVVVLLIEIAVLCTIGRDGWRNLYASMSKSTRVLGLLGSGFASALALLIVARHSFVGRDERINLLPYEIILSVGALNIILQLFFILLVTSVIGSTISTLESQSHGRPKERSEVEK